MKNFVCAVQRKFAWSVWATALMTAAAVGLVIGAARGDEPYARSKDYDLQHSRIELKFDIENKKVIGDVTHTLTVVKDGTSKLVFDSVGLTIQSVTLNKTPAKFEVAANKLILPLAAPAKAGEEEEEE